MTNEKVDDTGDLGRQHNGTLHNAMNGGLSSAVQDAGGLLTGFSIKIEEHSVLLTLRAVHSDTPMIAFIGGPNIPAVFSKAVLEVKKDMIRWRADRYAKLQT